MSSTAVIEESQPKKKWRGFFSERFSDALRENKLDDFSSESPYAAAIFPLLKSLGWKNISRELVEALPHCAEGIDLVDLRNILVNLGYDSESEKGSISNIKAELYPCLFIAESGEVLVLIERRGDEIDYFDCDQGLEVKSVSIQELSRIGLAYFFTDSSSAGGGSKVDKNQSGWFSNMVVRFRKLLLHLFAMTFVINMVALLVPLFIMLIYDKVIGAKSLESLPLLLSGVGILILADLVLRYFRAKIMGAVAGRMDYLIGAETFKQLLYLPPMFSERSTVTAQLSRLKQFESVRGFFTGPNASIVMELPFVFIFLIAIAFLAGPIALIPLIMGIAYVVFAFVWLPNLNKKVLRSGKARTNRQGMLIQTFDGRREIKAIGSETLWQGRFRELSAEAINSNHKSFITNAFMTNLSQSIMTLTGVSVLGFGALAVMEGTMSIGALIATMALVWRALSPIQGAFLSISKLQQTWLAIKQIDQLMRLKIEKKDAHSGLMTKGIFGSIKMDRVSFRYGPDQDPVLLGASFEAKQGEIVAIVGYTGSGKSTLLKLIAGMYKPQAGSLLMDDQDIRQLNVMELRRSIAYVPQEVQMFHGTIAQNMRLNNGLASDKELEEAAASAGALEDIQKLPDGFNTRIGDSSINKYPPGFLRAISIARALVSPAKIILLDEPGTSLDDESDRRLMKQIELLRGNRTVIIVSHRPSHIRLADKAVLLDKGTVQFAGAPEEAVSMMMGMKK
jgi:ATP-binding cassette subfamily C protein/ATP-binding cassette subfamily C protein LapB